MSRRLLVAFLSTCVLGGVVAAVAGAELSASGNLFVTFDGGILPNALPRHRDAPITVEIAGKVRTLSGEIPPNLHRIVIELNRNGRLDTRGLPVCRRAEIETVDTAEARRRCGDALVGTGAYVARVTFPEQPSASSPGRILAFNSVVGGKPAIVAQVHASKPAPITRTLVFRLRHGDGAYGTVLDAVLPSSFYRFGYLKRIALRLHRTYTYRGRTRSYLSASCPAPSGLREASFKFAHAAMTFADGRLLQSTLTRTCRVAE